nr:MAG TPA: hypothetical protein [Caudoviricetes sp.]
MSRQIHVFEFLRFRGHHIMCQLFEVLHVYTATHSAFQRIQFIIKKIVLHRKLCAQH